MYSSGNENAICSKPNGGGGKIGINTDEPKTTLDVAKGNSDFYGVLPPRVSKYDLYQRTYNASHDGTIVYVTDLSEQLLANQPSRYQVERVTSEGHYYFDATRNQWVRFNEIVNYNGNGFSPYKLAYSIAQNEIDLVGTTIGFVNLNLRVSIEVPAHSTLQIFVNYSVPVGLIGYTNNTFNDKIGTSVTGSGMVGTIFYRQEGNGEFQEKPEASRKSLLPHQGEAPKHIIHRYEIYAMLTLDSDYAETYTNNTNNPITLTYAIVGLIQNLKSEKTKTPAARFGMWSRDGENHNWGKAAITLESYIKNN